MQRDPRLLAARYPAYRRHEFSLGWIIEHANLVSDVKRKGARQQAEAESSEALERGGLTRCSDEAAVMAVERRGGATEAYNLVKWGDPRGTKENADIRQDVVGGTSRMT